MVNGPRLVKSELSAAGAKWDAKNTKKVPTSSVSWPHDPARPWPSGDDDGDHYGDNDRYDDGDDADKVIAVLLTLRMTAKSMMRLWLTPPLQYWQLGQ